jgi:ribosomal protein L17
MSSKKSVKRIGALSAEKFKHSYTVKDRMKQAASVAYQSTLGELTHGRVPIVDPLIKYTKEKFDIKYRGKTMEKIRENRETDKQIVNDFVSRFTKRKVGGKRVNKTRKNVSRKNRK